MSSNESATEASWLLAIDASTEQASIALFNGSDSAELSWHAGRNQTTTLLAEIARLGELAGCDLRSELECVAVATGPGMFNGLRVGMSIAKGFALAGDLALVGVPTLAIAAHPFAPSRRPVIAVAAAGRKRLLWQMFRGSGTAAGEPTNGVLEELLSVVDASTIPTIVTGELTAAHWAAIIERNHVIPAPVPAHLRRASSLAAIGWNRWRRGEIDDPTTLEPVYLHANATSA